MKNVEIGDAFFENGGGSGANVANTGAQLLLLVSNAISSVTHSRQAHFEKLQAKLERSRTLLMKAEQYAADGTLQGGAADYTIASKANALRISLEADLEAQAQWRQSVVDELQRRLAASGETERALRDELALARPRGE